jgi:hypothetical protein
VDPPVGVIDEEQPIPPDRVLATAVFVDPSANVDPGRARFFDWTQPSGIGERGDHHDLSSALGRPTLEPKESPSIEPWGRKPKRTANEFLRSDRRIPTSVGLNDLQ